MPAGGWARHLAAGGPWGRCLLPLPRIVEGTASTPSGPSGDVFPWQGGQQPLGAHVGSLGSDPNRNFATSLSPFSHLYLAPVHPAQVHTPLQPPLLGARRPLPRAPDSWGYRMSESRGGGAVEPGQEGSGKGRGLGREVPGDKLWKVGSQRAQRRALADRRSTAWEPLPPLLGKAGTTVCGQNELSSWLSPGRDPGPSVHLGGRPAQQLPPHGFRLCNSC